MNAIRGPSRGMHQKPRLIVVDLQGNSAASAADYGLALLTDGRSESQRYKIEALGIAGAFQEILVTDEMGLPWRKPSLAAPSGF